MYNKRRYIVKNIGIYAKIRKYLTYLCLTLIALGITSFFFFGFYSNSGAIKFIAKYKDEKNIKIEKVMINPKIKFEHSDNNFYDMTASKAVHKDDNNILMFDVEADGSAVNIKAGKLLVTNNGNNLKFTGNPVLIIKKTNNQK